MTVADVVPSGLKRSAFTQENVRLSKGIYTEQSESGARAYSCHTVLLPSCWGVANPLYGGTNGGATVHVVRGMFDLESGVFVVPEVFRGAVPLAFSVVRRGRGAKSRASRDGPLCSLWADDFRPRSVLLRMWREDPLVM